MGSCVADGQTDGRTDGRTDGAGYIGPAEGNGGSKKQVSPVHFYYDLEIIATKGFFIIFQITEGYLKYPEKIQRFIVFTQKDL